MPTKPMKPCGNPMCAALTTESYCVAHRYSSPIDSRPSSCKRGYGRKWREQSAAYLRVNNVCSCGRKSAVVDHIVPHNGDMVLFWDRSNWQPLCTSCHSSKTGRERVNVGWQNYETQALSNEGVERR